jgi:hypothetical protein
LQSKEEDDERIEKYSSDDCSYRDKLSRQEPVEYSAAPTATASPTTTREEGRNLLAHTKKKT